MQNYIIEKFYFNNNISLNNGLEKVLSLTDDMNKFLENEIY